MKEVYEILMERTQVGNLREQFIRYVYANLVSDLIIKRTNEYITEDDIFGLIHELTETFNERVLIRKKNKKYRFDYISIELKELNYAISLILNYVQNAEIIKKTNCKK